MGIDAARLMNSPVLFQRVSRKSPGFLFFAQENATVCAKNNFIFGDILIVFYRFFCTEQYARVLRNGESALRK